MFSQDEGVAAGKKLLFLQHGKWTTHSVQPPVPIDLLFAQNAHSLFISSQTKYQESELFFGDGKQWEEIAHPLANNIMAMYFKDKENGVIAGFGEIAVLENNKWKWLPVPVNHSIKSLFVDKNGFIWAVFYIQGGQLFKYDGSWTPINAHKKVTHIQMYHDTIFLLGNEYIGFIDDKDSINYIAHHKDLEQASSFFVAKKDEFVAIGTKGFIIHYKDQKWHKTATGFSENLNDVYLNKNKGWIVGDDGIIMQYAVQNKAHIKSNSWKGFESITFNSYAKIVDDEYGVVAADFNNDGKTDVFTCGLFEANNLYINKGQNHFLNEAQQWNVDGFENQNYRELNLGACAADFDNDGYIDLYVGVLNGKNKLYKNIKAKYFVDYSNYAKGVGLETDRTNSTIVGDVDNDGDLDLFITNETSTNRLYLNNGAGIFTEAQGVGLESQDGGMAASFGDIDQDGDLDLYVANWSSKNKLYKNTWKETGELFFEDISHKNEVGGEFYSKSNAVVFADIDNDADLDLLVTNRKTSNKFYINDGFGVFSDKTDSFFGADAHKSYGAVIGDFDGDGYKDIYLSNVGENVYYQNELGKKFIDKTAEYAANNKSYSTGSAIADFDNDGQLDIYMANYLEESSAILHNRNNKSAFINISITGYKNNRNAIGAKIYIYKDGELSLPKSLICYKEISGGSGFASMNQFNQPIPIPICTFVDIKVIFPSGLEVLKKHVPAGSLLQIEDLEGLSKTQAKVYRSIYSLKDSHTLQKAFNWLILGILLISFVLVSLKRYSWKLLYGLLLSLFIILVFYFQSSYFEYKNIWLFSVFPMLTAMAIMLLLMLYSERNRIRKQSQKEQEKIREKLSRDLHDDLASTVSTIAIYITLIGYNLSKSDKKLQDLLNKSSQLVGEASAAITDLIWAINPKSESMDKLMMRIQNNFRDLFKQKEILFHFSGEDLAESITLNSKVKQNLYLILKEALHNTVKYAQASKVEISLSKYKGKLLLSIKDNGIGFDYQALAQKGHGLGNMKIRAYEIEAEFEINSQAKKGTDIKLLFEEV